MKTHYHIFLAVLLSLVDKSAGVAQPDLRHELGQMLMVTVTGDSVEKTGASMDTLKSDLAQGLVGGLVMYTWSNNLENPGQIAHLTSELQKRASVPLLIAIDEEGGLVARLGPANGFSATPSAYQMGTIVDSESYTRQIAATMAGWFAETGLNIDLAPVVDVDVNPSSPAIGALGRSFSANPVKVSSHAGWFIDEFHHRSILTTLKHFPGHGSATTDSHLGVTDVTSTWSPMELTPYSTLLQEGVVDAIMTAHIFNATIDSVYPATLSEATIGGILRHQLGFHGVVVSDDMEMGAITSVYGTDQAAELAVRAGIDILLYTSNLDSTGHSLARRIVDVLAKAVQDGRISQGHIDSSYARIMTLKSGLLASVASRAAETLPNTLDLTSFPNPFNPETTIQFALPRATNVKLTLFNILGQQVALLADEFLPAGTHSLRFNASTMASGMYLCRLQTGYGATTHRLLLMK